MRIALVSRELYPLGGGGIGQFVAAAASLLARFAEVTVLTSDSFKAEFDALRAAGDPRLPPPEVRVAFVQEPGEEAAAWIHPMHLYSARVYALLQELFPTGGPDLIEFGDFLAEGFVTLQAARTSDPFLAGTAVCVRIHTSGELSDVLNGFLPPDPGTRALYAMERYCIWQADRLIWQGGDILDSYRRFYGERFLAPALRIRYPYRGAVSDEAADSEFEPGDTVRLLYAGRLERRKGVQALISAVSGMTRGDFRLTLHGGDTTKAPLGASMRAQLEQLIAGDPRIVLGGPLPREALAETIRRHDVVVIPSRWECWPYAALEPMHLNRPVLGTPVGGLVEMLSAGAGLIASGTDAVALEEALERLLDDRGGLAELVREARPLRQARRLSDDDEIAGEYQRLLAERPERITRRPTPSEPLVSAVIPYHGQPEPLIATVNSLLEQSYPRIEAILVNDGSFDAADTILAELAARVPLIVVTQLHQGRGAALNFGVQQTRGRYVLALRAGQTIHPGLVGRAVAALEQNRQLAYVSWWRKERPGDAPAAGSDAQALGNWASLWAAEAPLGAGGLIRRAVLDAGFSFSEELAGWEERQLYLELAREGYFGAVIPERLVAAGGVPEDPPPALRARLEGEVEALLRENGMRWTSSSA